MKTYVLYVYDDELENFYETIRDKKYDLDFHIFKGVLGVDIKDTYDEYCSMTTKEYLGDKLEKYKDVYEYVNKIETAQNRRMLRYIGEWGNIHSVMNIIEDAIQKDYDEIMIMEPDVIFIRNFNKMFKIYEHELKKCDVFYLGASQTAWKGITVENSKYKAKKTDGVFGVIIKKQVYEYFLELLKLRVMPSDSCLQFVQEKFNCIVAVPNLVIADVSDSNIRDGLNQRRTAQKCRWNLALYDINYDI